MVASLSRPAHAQEDQSQLPVTAVILREFPPTFFSDRAGKPSGFSVDVVERVAALAGLKVKYLLKDNWAEVREALLSGEADFCPNIGLTPLRRSEFLYTAPLETFRVVYFVRKTSDDIKTLADLAGRRVGVVRQSVAEEELSSESGFVLVLLNRAGEALFELLAGNIDALPFPEPVLMAMAERAGVEGHIRVVGEPLAESKRVMLVSKGQPELWRRLVVAVDAFVGSSDYQGIYNKWYGNLHLHWSPAVVIKIVGSLLLLAIGAMLLWRYYALKSINRTLTESIKQRHLAEKALRLSEDKWSKAFDLSPNWIAISSLTDGGILEVNRAFTDMTGLQRREVVGKDFQELGLWRDETQLQDLLTTLRQGGTVREKEVLLRLRQGVSRTVLWSAQPLQLASGMCFLNVATDISARKDLEEGLKRAGAELEEKVRLRTAELEASYLALKESEEKYRQLFENTHEAILVAQDYRYKFFNHRATELTDISSEELASIHILDLIHPADRFLVRQQYQARIHGEHSSEPYEIRLWTNRAGSNGF